MTAYDFRISSRNKLVARTHYRKKSKDFGTAAVSFGLFNRRYFAYIRIDIVVTAGKYPKIRSKQLRIVPHFELAAKPLCTHTHTQDIIRLETHL